jgi:predicted phage-related endonuclease
MKFTVIDAPQRSAAWFAARAGRLTGSRAADILAKIKTGEAAARRDYRLQLATERLTGIPQESGFVSTEMQRGIDLEATAFAAYEAVSGEMCRRTGFICADDLQVGCSLDGDIDDFRGIIELKCPKSTTHVGYWKAGALPAAHLAQVTHNLWVTGAEFCDFASYDNRLPAHLHLFKVRVFAKDVDIEGYAAEAKRFLAEVDAEVAALQLLGVGKAA